MTKNRSGATPQSLADKLIAPRAIKIRDARRAGEVLQRIADTLDNVEWDADTANEIANILESEGFTIRNPADTE